MTRINLIPVQELSDQHLFAEYRELPRLSAYAQKAIKGSLPASYRMGEGHVRFFLNKASWLEDRHKQLTSECLRRGIRLTVKDAFVMDRRFGDVGYEPSVGEVEISRSRIEEKLAMKPGWYKFSPRCE